MTAEATIATRNHVQSACRRAWRFEGVEQVDLRELAHEEPGGNDGRDHRCYRAPAEALELDVRDLGRALPDQLAADLAHVFSGVAHLRPTPAAQRNRLQDGRNRLLVMGFVPRPHGGDGPLGADD